MRLINLKIPSGNQHESSKNHKMCSEPPDKSEKHENHIPVLNENEPVVNLGGVSFFSP